MENRKKRGSNYTSSDKVKFMKIVKKFINVIENKETNAANISKKRLAWDEICQQYNAVAMSGPRTWSQLRHLYENLKQRAKKSIVGVNKLIGGSRKRVLNDAEETFAMIESQIKSSNDDVESYFLDISFNKNKRIFKSSESDAEIELDDPPTINVDVIIEENKRHLKSNENNKEETTRQKRVKLNKLRRMYFKTKLFNAKLEQKFIIEINKLELEKRRLEIEILKHRLKKIQNSPYNQHI